MTMVQELSKDVMRLNRALVLERLDNQNLRYQLTVVLDELRRRDHQFGGRVSEDQFSLLATDAGALQ